MQPYNYTKIREAEKILNEHGCIAHIWCIDDVKARLELSTYKNIQPLTDTEIYSILSKLNRQIDSELGINWLVIDCYIDDYLTEKGYSLIDGKWI